MNQTKLLPYFYAVLLALSTGGVAAQNTPIKQVQDSSYTSVINKRADKIVAEIDISDPSKKLLVRDIISNQYRNLNTVYTERDTLISRAKMLNAGNKAVMDTQIAIINRNIQPKLQKLHNQYLSQLSTSLSPQQIDQVKDGMTYGVLPITYHGYVDMIPTLKEEEKTQIKTWLTEAREYAMDAESSEKKHAWFGKYKGRINNYLSSRGYDAQKERDEWMKRLKAAEAAKGK